MKSIVLALLTSGLAAKKTVDPELMLLKQFDYMKTHVSRNTQFLK